METGLSARLNVTHGPDQVQATRPMAREGAWSVAEFDLAHLDISDKRIGKIWIDIFIDKPRMNRVVFCDLVLTWRRRAEV